MPIVRRILVPMDPSPCSIMALDLARSLADDLGASIDVLHVHEHEHFRLGSSEPMAPDALRTAERQMDDAVSRVKEQLGERLGRIVVQGDPLLRILETAGGYDLVVMGTHGRVGRLHTLIGSVAEGVVRNAPCPVLTVRVPIGSESFGERIHKARFDEGGPAR